MTASMTIKALRVKDEYVQCPEHGTVTGVMRVLAIDPTTAMASCVRTASLIPGRGSGGQCFFPVPNLTGQQVAAIAAQIKPGRFRVTLPGGTLLEGEVAAAQAAPAVRPTASGKFAQAQGGQGADQRGRAPSGGGAAKAAFGALSATANMVGAVAGAAGQIAGAAGQVAGSAASTVGSVAGLGKEGIGLARDGVKEAGAFGARRHQRKMREGKAKPSPKSKAGE
ncbi:hypothetical protein ACFVZ4_30120 [Streptomyces goshikiensis]|uniref:hypothetical protein n=1 Tax=Streptomyces goshikiensis TaxID=1942 RepID=UPI0036CC636B